MRTRRSRRGPDWTGLARAGQTAWLCGNLYEAVVDVPGLQAVARRGSGVLGHGSPVRYYLPVIPLSPGATAGALVSGWRSGGDRRMVGVTATTLASAIGCTAYLVRTVNVRLLRDEPPPTDEQRRQLVRTRHRWNAARLAALACGMAAFGRACPPRSR
ncbi:DUF1772 domain-containing protein [Amycolatopsis sp. FDAARGOS 1241]|uniref:DUF1772 domain-containing protein n=1 Tax=Amycolatopsis sp. FDAARGOS 1241 TaxID=2778070 RepID=UPI00194F844D|nr:DUF1772 domain-containing protein [Amycolatopsis sp. FDAARGOS 1241]QRP48427.1 DUF1772 domain-containing protein [Amycolatopsis sp. FDAARGOS 1241]